MVNIVENLYLKPLHFKMF